jgi:hypothetical protein
MRHQDLWERLFCLSHSKRQYGTMFNILMLLSENRSIVSIHILFTKASLMDISEFHNSTFKKDIKQKNNNTPFPRVPSSFTVIQGNMEQLKILHEKGSRVEKVRKWAFVSRGIYNYCNSINKWQLP